MKKLPVYKLVCCSLVGVGNAVVDFCEDHREEILIQLAHYPETDPAVLELVQFCDGIVIFSLGGLDQDSNRVLNKFMSHGKPSLQINLQQITSLASVDKLVDWIKRWGISTLFVFGSQVPGSYGTVKLVLEMWASRYPNIK